MAEGLARATHDGEQIVYQVQEPYQFLGSLLNDPHPEFPPAPAEREQFWREVLDYGPYESLEFVGWGEHVFPLEVLDWKDEAEYEYMNWSRERQRYQLWLEKVRTVRAGRREPVDWPPPKTKLESLEERLRAEEWDRVGVLQDLDRLGLLEPEDDDLRSGELEQWGFRVLKDWREASLMLRWVARFLDGALPQGCQSLLESTVGIEWFLEGPPQQQFLDPLSHLRFVLHHHLQREPPTRDSSLVVSMGGRFSAAFYHRLGPGGIAQLVGGGKVVSGTVAECPDVVAELAARALRQGAPALGARLSHTVLSRRPEHGQSWIELAVALEAENRMGWARSCLERARESGHDFTIKGELAAIAAAEPRALPDLEELLPLWSAWLDQFEDLSLEMKTALVLQPQLLGTPELEPLWQLPLPPPLKRRASQPSPPQIR